jgi:hypothetical protein
VFAAPLGSAHPQTIEELRPAAHVRYRIGGRGAAWIEGTYLARVDDSLRLTQPPPGKPLTIAVARLSDLQVSQGRVSRTGHGAAVGAAVGGGAGLILGIVALAEGCEGGFPSTCIITPTEVAVGAPLVFGALGAGLGAAIGAASHRERWTPVAGVGTNVTLMPQPRAVTLAVHLRL